MVSSRRTCVLLTLMALCSLGLRAQTSPPSRDASRTVDRHMRRVVEPGRFQVMVGASSEELVTAAFEVVAR